MNRLRKYVEWMSRGRRTNRIAYVEWQPDKKFSVADELLNNPDLKAVFKEALKTGVALHSAPNPRLDE